MSTMSAVSFRPIFGVLAAQGNSILLSALVGFLNGLVNSDTVLSCVNLSPTVVIHICLLTICHICTHGSNVPVAANIAIL